MTHTITKRVWQLLTVALFIPILYYWWEYNQLYFLDSPGWPYTLQAIARLMALLGIVLLWLQLPLASRWPYLERVFGQDILMQWHRKVGLAGFFTIFFGHIVSLDIAHLGLYGGASWLTYFIPAPGFKSMGQTSFILFVLIIVVSIFQKRLRIPYHWFKRIHFIAYLALLLGFIHGMNLGSDLFLPGPLRTYFLALFILAHVIALYRLIYVPLKTKLNPWQVTKVESIAKHVHHITLQPKNGDVFAYFPGQFVFIRFPSISREWHPFTISSSPTEVGHITITPKSLGDWTGRLGELANGQAAHIQGPYGRFSYTLTAEKTNPLVFIAGGIGITPLRSMLKHYIDTKHNQTITLFFAATTQANLAFQTELDTLAATNDNVSIVYILNETTEAQFTAEAVEVGRLNEAMIKKYVSDLSAPDWFVCGPPPMMAAIENMLRKTGVNKTRIHSERFALK